MELSVFLVGLYLFKEGREVGGGRGKEEEEGGEREEGGREIPWYQNHGCWLLVVYRCQHLRTVK